MAKIVGRNIRIFWSGTTLKETKPEELQECQSFLGEPMHFTTKLDWIHWGELCEILYPPKPIANPVPRACEIWPYGRRWFLPRYEGMVRMTDIAAIANGWQANFRGDSSLKLVQDERLHARILRAIWISVMRLGWSIRRLVRKTNEDN